MPMPRPAGGRHAVTQGADEVGVHAGHGILFGKAGQLLREELLLQVGVVELGVGVGHFHAMDEQLEPFGDGGIVGLALGQGADAGRVVEDEDRAGEAALDLGFEQLADDDVGGCLPAVSRPASRARASTAAASAESTPVCSANSSA